MGGESTVGSTYEARYGTGLAPAELGRGRTWVEVNLSAIGANIAAIKGVIAPRLFMAVVKANAYGHGMAPIARAARRLGADAVAVATSEEALALRAADVDGTVLVMGHSHPDHAAALVQADVSVAVYTMETARALAAAAAAAGRRAKVHLKVDTGLCRVGLPPQDAVAFANGLRDLSSLSWEGIFTHFSCADDGDVARTREEFDLFRGVLARLEAAGHRYRIRHAAATAAFLESPETWMDMVRVGIAMYGHYPYRGCRQTVPLCPALEFKTRITRLRRVTAGTGVGYGRTYIAPRDTVIATIPVGYADGLDKHLGNRGEVLVRGRRVPRAGTIAMDLSMLDVGTLDKVEVGDEVVIIGAQGRDVITLEEVAETAGTSVEHTLTLLSGRPSRVYLER
jgi:alanine racemase